MVLVIQKGIMNQTVKLFNELSRPSRPQSMSNDWYFDVRYVPLEPTPYHMLFLIRPADKFVHTERLPMGVLDDKSGIEYFPETAEEAAPEVAHALIHSFVSNFGKTISQKASAPWKLSTFDPGLAVEVGKAFKEFSVREDLWRINMGRNIEPLAQLLCDNFFTTLAKSMGVTYPTPSPQTIGFSNYRPPPDNYFTARAKISANGNTKP